MRDQPQTAAAVSLRWDATWCVLLLLPPLLIGSCFLSPAAAEVRLVTAEGHHRMADHDTREDAVRLATESAKRNALEQVATYLESITVVKGMDLLKDEIHTYTAGLVEVLEQQTDTMLEGDTIIVTVRLVTRIDTAQVAQAIAALRENEDARVQLAALKRDNERLQNELNAANQAIATASTPNEALQASQHRQDILNHVQSNAMVSQAWTDWALVSPVLPYPWAQLAQTHALLTMARTLYPASPYVTSAQQVITTRHPPAPPHPPIPPTGGSPVFRMPSHEVVAAPGSPGVPRTLNEITHRTPARPPQISNQPHNGHQESQANIPMQPFLQPHEDLLPARPMRVPAPEAAPDGNASGPPPSERRFSPTINHLPHDSHQIAPRASGQGSRSGARGIGDGEDGGKRRHRR